MIAGVYGNKAFVAAQRFYMIELSDVLPVNAKELCFFQYVCLFAKPCIFPDAEPYNPIQSLIAFAVAKSAIRTTREVRFN